MSIPKGGGAFLDRHTLFSFHTCALGLIRESYIYLAFHIQILAAIQFLSITCLLSCWITFMVALRRNGQSCTLSPQLVLVCKFNAHDAQTKGTLAKFDSPGQSLVKTASLQHDYYKFRPKYISEVVELYFPAEFTCWQISARSSQSSFFWFSHLHYITFYTSPILHHPMGSTLCQSLLVAMYDWPNIF